MAISSGFISGNTIESASHFFGGGILTHAPRQTTKTPLPKTIDPRQQQAMARRLDQLQAALGEPDLMHVQAAAPDTMPSASRQGYGAITLLLTGLLSAMLGAGVMGLANSPHAPAALAQPASVQPVEIPIPVAIQAKESIAIAPKISDDQQVSQLVEAWRNAWQSRDIAGYLKSYGTGFSPADGNSREAWIAARQKKLATGAAIGLQINDLKIERVDQRQFKASFRQDYISGSYREIARPKTLLIALEGNEWKITREWQD